MDYRQVCPPYLDILEWYPQLKRLLETDCLTTFREDALRIGPNEWTPWPETHHYSSSSNDNDDDNASWTVVPLCYCFPATSADHLQWVPHLRDKFAVTCQLLQDIVGPFLRTALFSRLAPQTTLEAHSRWFNLATFVLRLHILLVIPSNCGM